IVAYHEMGHALVALALPGTDAVHKVSIVPRGVGALGYTIQRPTEDRFLMTKEELLNKIAVILGGRAAEKLVFDHLSTGAADDLVRATDIARALVARYGMDEELGSVAYDVERSPFLQPAPGQFTFERRYSEDTAREIDLAVRRLVDQQFERTLGILSRNREVLERCAKELLQVETLDEAALRRLTSDLRPESAREKVAA
ncbi:MAG: cell division protein FtsH, partial [Geminicoccaceae bacterium]|nr:cell division protein FtsH [Geminicoccaceae bacterium]